MQYTHLLALFIVSLSHLLLPAGDDEVHTPTKTEGAKDNKNYHKYEIDIIVWQSRWLLQLGRGTRLIIFCHF